MNKENCCCEGAGERREGCIVCGKPLIYSAESTMRECVFCHRVLPGNAVCEDGHFVCDQCHARMSVTVLEKLMSSEERDPIRLFLELAELPAVHLHGPEHHSIVPCVLLTAYHNCGGELDLPGALAEAWSRGKQVPGGACGYLGVCGAAAGAGIYASIVTGSNPLNAEAWALPQLLVSRCLERMAHYGGPRCCKRTGWLAIETAAEFTKERLGVTMPLSSPACTFCGANKECLGGRCPFHPASLC